MQWPHWHWLQKKHGHLHVALRREAKSEGEQRGKPHLVGKIRDRPRHFGTVLYSLRDAEQVCSCSGPLCYLVGGGGTQQEGFCLMR